MCGLLSVTSSFPVVAVTLMALLSCCYVVLIGFVDLETWMIFATNVNLPFVALSAFSLIYMRINKPEIQRPLKLPLIVPTIFAGMCTILFITPIFTLLLDVTNGIKDNKRVQKYVGFLAGPALLGLTGIPIYRILIRGDKSHRCIRLVHDKLTLLAQKVFVALPEGALMKNKRHSR
ncbi:cystine/glutamate transporter-like [Folsomia candida]|nr:cystine/glutamate transporter-like [Folsomia candida]